MDFEIEWTKRADKEFDEIIDYLAKEWNVKVKNNFINNFYNKLDLILMFPELGKLISKTKKVRGILITEHIRLYYRIKNKRIIIMTLYDTRQDPEKMDLGV